jgi:hypothetical protein
MLLPLRRLTDMAWITRLWYWMAFQLSGDEYPSEEDVLDTLPHYVTDPALRPLPEE